MPDSADKFTNFLRRLVRVPKEEIDEQERLYQDEKREPAKPRGIIVRDEKRKSG